MPRIGVGPPKYRRRIALVADSFQVSSDHLDATISFLLQENVLRTTALVSVFTSSSSRWGFVANEIS